MVRTCKTRVVLALVTLGGVSLLGVSAQAAQAPTKGVASLAAAGGSGASGTARLSWDQRTKVLTVIVTLSGLTPDGHYTAQITPGCSGATGHIYKLVAFTANTQGSAQATTKIPHLAAINLKGGWSIKVGNPGSGQIACGPVTAPGAKPPATTPPVGQPVTVWQTGSGPVSSPAEAAKSALAVVQARGWTSLTLDEVHIFPAWFEVEFNDTGGFKGPELYVNSTSGNIGPEQGPNSGWDTVYGKGICTTDLSQANAEQIAQGALAGHTPSGGGGGGGGGAGPGSGGPTLGDAEQHHGYWEFEIEHQGTVINQLNVNNCTQQVVFEDQWQPAMIGTYTPTP
jgi:hypothetical protein